MRFMHIVHAQPFADRKKWFYENLYGGKPPSNELTLAAETNSILVDRGDSLGWLDQVLSMRQRVPIVLSFLNLGTTWAVIYLGGVQELFGSHF